MAVSFHEQANKQMTKKNIRSQISSMCNFILASFFPSLPLSGGTILEGAEAFSIVLFVLSSLSLHQVPMPSTAFSSHFSAALLLSRMIR